MSTINLFSLFVSSYKAIIYIMNESIYNLYETLWHYETKDTIYHDLF